MLGADCQVLEVVEVGDDHLKSWIVDRIGRGAERSDSFNVAIVRQLLKDGVSFGGAPDKGVESGLLALTVMIARLTASCAADLRVETTEAHHGDHEGPDAEHELDVVSIHPADRTRRGVKPASGIFDCTCRPEKGSAFVTLQGPGQAVELISGASGHAEEEVVRKDATTWSRLNGCMQT